MRPEVKHITMVRGEKAMAVKGRKFTREVKLQVVREVEAGKPVAQAAREYEVHPTQLTKWRQLHRRSAEQAFAGNGQAYQEEAKIGEGERLVGRLTMGNALLKCKTYDLIGQVVSFRSVVR
jgi:transposase